MKKRRKRTSKIMCQNPLFLRNEFTGDENWGIPLLTKSDVELDAGIELIGFNDTNENDRNSPATKIVHFFADDYKFECVYERPDDYYRRLAPYGYVLTPDYSLDAKMPLAVQLYNVFKSRWCGALWQYWGLSVIPTISWSTSASFSFCFAGVSPGSVVAIATIGNLKNEQLFMSGYREMQRQIAPKQVVCFGKAFMEMGHEVIAVDYLKATRRGKSWVAGENHQMLMFTS